ncbi:MAG: diguanylate cyclase, partial [Chitinivibrionales bacterium]|nr:diguanylate cyclase [Chitinivibrionales bacterium]
FAVVLPENNEKGAMVTAERIRTAIQNHIIRSADRELRVTVSIGCSVFPAHADKKSDLVNHADKALYMSKEQGRNRSTLWKKSMG